MEIRDILKVPKKFLIEFLNSQGDKNKVFNTTFLVLTPYRMYKTKNWYWFFVLYTFIFIYVDKFKYKIIDLAANIKTFTVT